MLGTLPVAPLIVLTWARNDGPGPAHSQLRIDTYIYPGRRQREGILGDQDEDDGGRAHLGCNRTSFLLCNSSCIKSPKPSDHHIE